MKNVTDERAARPRRRIIEVRDLKLASKPGASARRAPSLEISLGELDKFRRGSSYGRGGAQ
jgi:hypothetical protein